MITKPMADAMMKANLKNSENPAAGVNTLPNLPKKAPELDPVAFEEAPAELEPAAQLSAQDKLNEIMKAYKLLGTKVPTTLA
jgi:hypothetical protein